MIEAWEEMLHCRKVFAGISSAEYDLVDIGRQVLSKLATKFWKNIEAAYREKDVKSFQVSIAIVVENVIGLLCDTSRAESVC